MLSRQSYGPRGQWSPKIEHISAGFHFILSFFGEGGGGEGLKALKDNFQSFNVVIERLSGKVK